MRLRAAILSSLFVCTYLCVQASHVVGGNLGYAFLGNAPGGLLRYKIILTTYTDCSPTSEIPAAETSVSVGVYFHDAANPNANKNLKQAYTLPLISSQLITPPLPPGCSVGLGTCIKKNIYELEVLLEPTVHGYHLYYERCCRNTALVNIVNPSQTSTGFYAFIPPTSLPNSSPIFLDDPVPLICIGDSLHLLNTAMDPDGDFLLYSFTVPYAGFADIFNPAPAPGPFLQWPIAPVTYQSGFSLASPFGPGGYTYINALTGQSVYKTSLPGNFTVAVQVSEYRNGVLMATTRRDMQFIGLVCPQNRPPDGTFPTGLEIQAVEGDTLCFDFTYQDPESDSVFLEVAGEPFLSFPPASFSQSYTSAGAVHGQICWTPPCGSARSLPYLIAYKAYDDGCIPKERINVMKITVVPDTARMHISGDTLVCGLQTATYQASKTTGTFQWTVTGGNINPPSQASSATVDWNLQPNQQGTLQVIRDGVCRDDTAALTVHIAPPQFAGHLQDIWLCPGSTRVLEAEPGGSGYLWTPGDWLSDTTIYNPVTQALDSIWYFVAYRDQSGCEKFDSVLVAVNSRVPVDAGNDISVCEGSPITLGGNPTGPPGAFLWSPGGVLSDGTAPNPVMPVPQQGWYHVHVTVDTCHGADSVQVIVFGLPAVDAGNDTSACFGVSIRLNGSGTGNMAWNANGATLDNPQLPNPFLSGQPDTYHPILTVTSDEGCSASDTVSIQIFPLPDIHITGNTNICRGDSVLLAASGAQDYVWGSQAVLSTPLLPATHAVSDTSVWVFVAGSDANGCASADSIFLDVFSGSLQFPQGKDTLLCLGESVSIGFVSSPTAATVWVPADYLDTDIGQAVVSSPTQDITYTVYANNELGCVDSATVSLYVKPLPSLEGSVTYQSQLFCGHVEVDMATSNTGDSAYWLVNGTYAGTGSEITLHLSPQHTETVLLVGVTAFGCTDTLAIQPEFETLEELLPTAFPNIITPNGDMVNDEWHPTLPEGFAGCMRLSIFNRWGTRVFDSDTFPLVWDGKTKAGSLLTDGVYFYVLEIGGVYKKGSVTIAR